MNKPAVALGAVALGAFVLVAFSPRSLGASPDTTEPKATSEAKKSGDDKAFEKSKNDVKMPKSIDAKGAEGKCAAAKMGRSGGGTALTDRCTAPNPPEWCKHPLVPEQGTTASKEKDGGGG